MAAQTKRLGAWRLSASIVGVLIGLYALALLIWLAIGGQFGHFGDLLNRSELFDGRWELYNAGYVLWVAHIAVVSIFGLALLIGLFSLISLLTKGGFGVITATVFAWLSLLLAVVGGTALFAAATVEVRNLNILGLDYQEDRFGIFTPAAVGILVGLLAVFVLLRFFRSASADQDGSEEAVAAPVVAEPVAEVYEQTAVLQTPVAPEYPEPQAEEPIATETVNPEPVVEAQIDPVATPQTAGDIAAADDENGADEALPDEEVLAAAAVDQPTEVVATPEPEPTPEPEAVTPAPATTSARPFAQVGGEYYLQIGGVEYGPYTAAQVSEFADEGRINENTQIRPAQGYYESAKVVPGLFS